MNKNKIKVNKRMRRRGRIRARVMGTSEVPRLSVFRSLRGIYVQLVDDASGKTLVSAGSNDEEIKKLSPHGGFPEGREIKKQRGDDEGKVGVAYVVGELVARRALEKGIKRAVFDRGGYRYHGRVKAVADGARRGGLKF